MEVFLGIAVIAVALGFIAHLAASAVEEGQMAAAVEKQRRRMARMLEERPFEKFERDEQRWFLRHIADDKLDLAEKVLENRRSVL